ncbi:MULTISPECIES: UDP-N-acetylmuramoyl-L-alanyl-D-glutamate--2,6-diaminopimelate ligase [unclassified Virgibacillus]|uniref:UDP-N-acetylmuramoyl-L-alanyl-D-glutamate--2, 6-diaminopimelate ligase n=1 Tax=unclassified Virgibacillus TaxID=2620237 RepID=UPI0024DE0EF3|nr:UDP-N-acetylmuramoyl-L-alanyl-D-glutamate--2,6-diaminopimelate ligase [Virgibacillus sp. LDC-1]
MKLLELLTPVPFYTSYSELDNIEVQSLKIDSRAIEQGDVFICITGFSVDGHNYIPQAIENGAVAIIAEKKVEAAVPVIVVSDTTRALALLASHFYNYPSSQLPLIGITGTNGKTTITYLLDSIYRVNGKKTGVIGTIQMKIGDEAFPIQNTTPDALFLQRTFHQMIEAGVEQGIMEVSSHALDQGRVHGTDFDIAIFTNLSQDHLDYHKDLDDYLRAKSLLFAQLGNSYIKAGRKFAILNADDSSIDLLKRSTAQHVLTYGCRNDADVSATDIQLHAGETTYTLVTPIGTINVKSRLIGMFNVYNMLAAASAAIADGVNLQVIKQAFETIPGVNGRFEPVKAGQDFGVIVDYAHTPDSLENVLQTVQEFVKGKIYAIVGCGGDRDRTKRPLMAQIATKYADHAVLTSDNPRTEQPEAILQDMVNGLTKETNYEVIVDRKQAIHHAVALAKNDDIILIAGKGHETYQQIGHEKLHFDDREVAQEAIVAKERK